MSKTSGLTVRQHEREGIQVPIEFVICEEHRAQVHFSSTSSAIGQHAVKGQAVDISPGGMGLELRQFVPRMCEGIVRVVMPATIQIEGSAELSNAILFEHRAKVRRVFLTGRDPIYTIGLAFLNPGTEVDAQIAELLQQVKQMSAKSASSSNGSHGERKGASNA
jgi:hypothetical protein